MNKFKVGDRCKYKSLDGYIGTVVFVNNGCVAVRFDNKSQGTSFYCDGKQIEHGWWLEESAFEILPHNNKIVITQSDNRTIARLYNDNKVIKSAEAKCSPTDTYDFAIGAKLAFERLMPASEPKKSVVEEKKTFDWQAFRTGKISALCKKSDVNSFLTECESRGIECCDGTKATKHPMNDPNDYHWRELKYASGVVFECSFHSGKLEFDCPKYITNFIEYPFASSEPTTPKEPTYYSGKVVCVECIGGTVTVGKIYSVVDGFFKDDQGGKRPCINKPIPSFEAMEHIFHGKRFIEYKGEAL